MSHYHRLTIAEVRPETREAITVRFAVPEELSATFQFVQGQHLNLRARINGEEARRSYSICEAPGGGLRILIKRQPGGIFSNWANEQLKAGDELELMPPAGVFHTRLDPGAGPRRYLAIAAGSGITPVLSLIKTTLAVEPRSDFTLFYGNHATSSILFRDELADLKDVYLGRLSLVHVLSREHQDMELVNGRLTPERVAELLQHWGPLAAMEAVFICGPHEMNRALAASLTTSGYPKARVHLEQFAASQAGAGRGPARLAAPTMRDTVCEATIVLDGRRYSVPVARGKETVLDAGLRAGVDLRFSCKSGVCATCRAKLLEGEVDMGGNFALEDYEIARGYILTCQSYPITPRITVDFDQD